MNTPIHTSDRRHADRLWLMFGGSIVEARRTGEKFYIHPQFDSPLRLDSRRKDTAAKLTSRLNQLRRAVAANDSSWR